MIIAIVPAPFLSSTNARLAAIYSWPRLISERRRPLGNHEGAPAKLGHDVVAPHPFLLSSRKSVPCWAWPESVAAVARSTQNSVVQVSYEVHSVCEQARLQARGGWV